MVVDFVQYVEIKKTAELEAQAGRNLELDQQSLLERFLTELLAELEAA